MSAPAPADGATRAVGSVTIEPLDLERDLGLLHAWVTHPRSVFWLMQGASLDDVRREYGAIVDSEHHDAWLGRVDGRPAFLAETYDPARSDLAPHHDTRPGDLGMHVLVAPPVRPVHGFTAAVFAAVVRHCLAQTTADGHPVERVVVEPDAGNTAIHALNARAGFTVLREVGLPQKRALLSVCTREQFERSELGAPPDRDPTGDPA